MRLAEWLSELMQTPRRVAESARAYAALQDFPLTLQANRDNYVYYPDVMVVCGRELEEDRYVANPKLIVEVLSTSTAGVDRHEKRVNYRWIPGSKSM